MLYIAILFIIILIYINKKNTIKEKMGNKKGLLLLYGESFREGKQGERLRDTEASVEPQKKSSMEHVHLCNVIKDKYHYDMDILINTYDTKYETTLKSWYAPYSLKYFTNKELIGPDNLVKNALSKINSNEYDFIIFTRMDVCFKPYFIDNFSINHQKIMFISIHNIHYNTREWKCGFMLDVPETPVQENTPVVNGTILIVPKKHYLIFNNMTIDHHAWWEYNRMGIKNEDMDFILDTYHDADPFKESNPAYYFSSRPETIVVNDVILDRGLIGSNKELVC